MIFSPNTGSFEKYVQTLVRRTIKAPQILLKILGFALYFQLLSVFGNQRKSSYLCLNFTSTRPSLGEGKESISTIYRLYNVCKSSLLSFPLIPALCAGSPMQIILEALLRTFHSTLVYAKYSKALGSERDLSCTFECTIYPHW